MRFLDSHKLLLQKGDSAFSTFDFLHQLLLLLQQLSDLLLKLEVFRLLSSYEILHVKLEFLLLIWDHFLKFVDFVIGKPRNVLDFSLNQV